ncbi:hypothetical protein PDE_06589 [Penicillium oxalicum 114-2]|uniref:Uncharacterized protein n=1 Tax=Penicillium oxalicum (strain 114-2 / CGMCC 5302) TaxID=933388 RepID=S7ZMQ5_PENO1|nr:hypothetical protein PDE_06589 [Penicillium oxalicum 114-2]
MGQDTPPAAMFSEVQYFSSRRGQMEMIDNRLKWFETWDEPISERERQPRRPSRREQAVIAHLEDRREVRGFYGSALPYWKEEQARTEAERIPCVPTQLPRLSLLPLSPPRYRAPPREEMRFASRSFHGNDAIHLGLRPLHIHDPVY